MEKQIENSNLISRTPKVKQKAKVPYVKPPNPKTKRTPSQGSESDTEGPGGSLPTTPTKTPSGQSYFEDLGEITPTANRTQRTYTANEKLTPIDPHHAGQSTNQDHLMDEVEPATGPKTSDQDLSTTDGEEDMEPDMGWNSSSPWKKR